MTMALTYVTLISYGVDCFAGWYFFMHVVLTYLLYNCISFPRNQALHPNLISTFVKATQMPSGLPTNIQEPLIPDSSASSNFFSCL